MSRADTRSDQTINNLYCCKCHKRTQVLADVAIGRYANCPLCRGIAINARETISGRREDLASLEDLFCDLAT